MFDVVLAVSLLDQELMHTIGTAVVGPVPHLKDDPSTVRPVMDVFVVEAKFVRDQSVIVPEAQQQQAVGFEPRFHTGYSSREVFVAQTVGDRVVAGNDDVEGICDGRAQIAKVGDTKSHVDAEVGGRLPGSLDRYRAQVRGMDLVAQQRQTNRLCADSAGAIK